MMNHFECHPLWLLKVLFLASDGFHFCFVSLTRRFFPFIQRIFRGKSVPAYARMPHQSQMDVEQLFFFMFSHGLAHDSGNRLVSQAQRHARIMCAPLPQPFAATAASWPRCLGSYDESMENVQINCIMMMHINRYITLALFVFMAL